jgi:hypothetical protein
MKTTKLGVTSRCPYCAYELDAASTVPGVPDASPNSGDVTICIACAGVMIFQQDLSVRKPTEVELAVVLADPDVLQLIKVIIEMNFKGTHVSI